jgi:hypothetical protein
MRCSTEVAHLRLWGRESLLAMAGSMPALGVGVNPTPSRRGTRRPRGRLGPGIVGQRARAGRADDRPHRSYSRTPTVRVIISRLRPKEGPASCPARAW